MGLNNDYYLNGQDAHSEEHSAVTRRSARQWEFESLPAHQLKELDPEAFFIREWNAGRVRRVIDGKPAHLCREED